MFSREKVALAAIFAATSCAAAVGFIALDSFGVLEIATDTTSRLSDRIPQRSAAEDKAVLLEKLQTAQSAEPHLNYVPATALPLKLAAYTDEAASAASEAAPVPSNLGPSDEAQIIDGDGDGASDAPDAWSAEVRSEPKLAAVQAPRVTGIGPPAPLVGHAPAIAGANSRSLQQRLTEISPGANQRLAEKFNSAVAAWPPSNIALVAIKDEKVLDLYARPDGGKWKFIYRYPVLAESGVGGPKLRQGDKQVPEGIYGISLLNPNSRFHVSLRVNYPNAFDKQMAAHDGRTNLGGDIMIHGKNASIGCLAIGDAASEEVFVLANKVGLANIKVIIAPTDFRKNGMPAPDEAQPKWVPGLYKQVASAMAEFEAPPSDGLLSFLFK